VSFINITDYPALRFAHRDMHGEQRNVVVLAITLDIGVNGELTPAPEQQPINFTELDFEQTEPTPIRRESDLAPFKSKVDLVINAHAFAPNDLPVRRVQVAACVHDANPDGSLGEMTKSSFLMITGPRRWRYRMLPGRMIRRLLAWGTLGLWQPSLWRKTAPEKFISAPIRYDYAYGGHLTLDDAHRTRAKVPLNFAYPGNPLGRGYLPTPSAIKQTTKRGSLFASRWAHRWASKHRAFAAPQIEVDKKTLRSAPHKAYPLAGWGTVAKHWTPRIDLAGTFDEKWEQQRNPLLPEDFNPLYWNGAHPDLQLDHLAPDAYINLYRVIPSSRRSDQILSIRLPGYAFALEYQDLYLPEPVTESMRLDTVHIDVTESRLTLLYRANLPELDQPAYLQLSQKETT
jgi:hypothetical protein